MSYHHSRPAFPSRATTYTYTARSNTLVSVACTSVSCVCTGLALKPCTSTQATKQAPKQAPKHQVQAPSTPWSPWLPCNKPSKCLNARRSLFAHNQPPPTLCAGNPRPESPSRVDHPVLASCTWPTLDAWPTARTASTWPTYLHHLAVRSACSRTLRACHLLPQLVMARRGTHTITAVSFAVPTTSASRRHWKPA